MNLGSAVVATIWERPQLACSLDDYSTLRPINAYRKTDTLEACAPRLAATCDLRFHVNPLAL